MTQWIRRLLLGLPIAGALAFGATQATAAPRWPCDGPDLVYVGYCPFGEDCGQYCASGMGTCVGNGCCRCVI